MNLDRIRLLSHAEPFQPFAICLSDGQRLAVDHPEFLAISPTHDALVVFKPDGNFAIVQTDQITCLETRKRPSRTKSS